MTSKRGGPANELEEISRRLRWFRTVKPTQKRRVEAEALLASKWDGVQVSAAQVLAAWGGRESVGALRTWLELRVDRRDPSTSVVRPGAVALGQCVEEEDVEWALDLYLKAGPDTYRQNELFPLLEGLPRSSTVSLVKRRAASGDDGAKRALRHLQATAPESPGRGRKSG
jgi:hypothetical protein